MIVNFEGHKAIDVIQELWIHTQYTGLGHLRAKEGKPPLIEFEEALKDIKVRFIRGKPIFVNFDNFPLLESEEYDRLNKMQTGDSKNTMIYVKKQMKEKLKLLQLY